MTRIFGVCDADGTDAFSEGMNVQDGIWEVKVSMGSPPQGK